MPISEGEVTLRLSEGIATIEFFHPKGNSLPAILLRRIADEIARAGELEDARVIVLRSGGEGPFCAGASFDEFREVDSPEHGQEFFLGFARIILAMTRAPKFVVTRVQGKVAGGGIGIVAASDYTIAERRAALRLSELAVGIGPFVVGPVIEHKIGLAAFSAMAVDAAWRDSTWAERVGLYARICDNVSELDDAVNAQAKVLAASNPDAMREMKKVFWRNTSGWEQLMTERAALSGRMVLSDFTKKAIAAFGAK